jgi:RNase H-fold protein (predicted Holliday junction resolvase)
VAQRNLINANQKNISRTDDVESARVILQGWLDKKINK